MTKNNVLLVMVSVMATVVIMKLMEPTPAEPIKAGIAAKSEQYQVSNDNQVAALVSPVKQREHQVASSQVSEATASIQDEMTQEQRHLLAKMPKEESKTLSLVSESGAMDMDLAQEQIKIEDFESYIHGLYDPADETSILKQQHLTEKLGSLAALTEHRYIHNCGQKVCAIMVEDVEDSAALMKLINKNVDLGASFHSLHTDPYGVKALRIIYNQDNSPEGKSIYFSLKQPS